MKIKLEIEIPDCYEEKFGDRMGNIIGNCLTATTNDLKCVPADDLLDTKWQVRYRSSPDSSDAKVGTIEFLKSE